MHWEKEIRIRITIRRVVFAVLAASTVTNLVIVGAVVGDESTPPALMETAALTMPAPIQFDTVAATVAEVFTVTSAPTAGGSPTDALTPSPTSTPSAEAPFWMMCIKRFYWPTYRVQVGDRLFALARVTGSSVPELMAANCLKSDQIYAGQVLYVPRLPSIVIVPTDTPTATQTPTDTSTATPTDSPTPTPTDTPTPTTTPTATATPTQTPTPTNTFTPTPTVTSTPTPTVLSVACDRAELIAETIPPGTVMSLGQSFSKTWQLTNIGQCTWTTSYSFVLLSGELFGMPKENSLPYNVAPGETIRISFDLTAPTTTGTHRGEWMFKNSNGILFGIGPNANQPWSVEINVVDISGMELRISPGRS